MSAKLPDGTQVPIVGQAVSLDDRSVTTDSSTGRLVGTTDARKTNTKFIAIGAGAGLVLGQVIGKKPLIGTILGAAAGYLYGAKQVKPAVGKDVMVPAGTRFGIMLTEDVTVSDAWSTASPSSTRSGADRSRLAGNVRQPATGDEWERSDGTVPLRDELDPDAF